MTGGEALDWVAVHEPFECIEVVVRAELRESVEDEMRAPGAADLRELYGDEDPVLWLSAARLRAGALGAPVSDLEGDTIIRHLIEHMVQRHIGGRRIKRGTRPLDAARLARVTDFIHAHLGRSLSIEELAAACAVSPFHFIRAFKATTLVTPHRYVTIRRMELARDLMLDGRHSAAEAANTVGYADGHQFRKVFKREFGLYPRSLERLSV